MQHQPAALDRPIQAGPVFGRRCALPKQEGALIFSIWIRPSCNGLNTVGDLQELARRLFGNEVRPVRGEFHIPSFRQNDEASHFLTIGHAGSGGPNASSPEIFARIL